MPQAEKRFAASSLNLTWSAERASGQRSHLSPLSYLLAILVFVPMLAPAQEPEPTFRTSVNEVLLDLVVRDKHARIIRDLRPEEIQIFEDGVQQKVRHFDFVDGHLGPAPNAGVTSIASTSGDRGGGAASAEEHNVQELRDISVISVVIASLDPRGRKLTVDAMRKFVKTELKPNMYVGVFSLSMAGLRTVQTYTNDGEKISSGVERATSNVLISQLGAINSAQFAGGRGSADATGGGSVGSTEDASDGASAGAAGASNAAGGALSASSAAGAGPAAAIANLMSTSWVSEMQDVYVESQRYLTPLQMLVRAQREIPGRKVMLLFSAGLPVQNETAELLNAVISNANRANVSIYALDTRGITSASTLDNSRRVLKAAAQASMRQQLSRMNGGDQTVTADEVLANEMADQSIHSDTRYNLAALAEGTGGELLPDTLDLLEPLERAVESVRTHYELTYSPANAVTDGTFRKIEVKVSRPGAKIFSRSGYYALPALNGRQIYPFEMATMKAINTTPPLHQFEFHVAALQYRPGPVRTQMEFVFQAPTRDLTVVKDAHWAKVHVCVTGLVKDEHGLVVQKISKDIPYDVPVSRSSELQRGVVSFTAPFELAPGHYTLETATVDRQSMKASVKRTALMVSDTPGLAVSDVAIARRVDAIGGSPDVTDPLQAHGGKIMPELSQVQLEQAEGKIRFYAVAYPPAPADAPVDASVEIWNNGKLLIKSPASAVPLDPTGAASILASLPIAKLTAGEYEAHVTFQFKGQSVTKAVPFVLAAGT
jgi:VWFA-related protein